MGKRYRFDSRLQGIAQMLDQEPVGGLEEAPPAVIQAARQALNDAGILQSDSGEGFEADAAEVFALRRLVEQGSIRRADARAYLEQRFPDARWGRGGFGSWFQSFRLAELNDRALRSRDPAREIARAQRDVQGDVLAGSPPSVDGGLQAILRQLPDEYDAAAVRRVVGDAVDQVARNLQDIRRGDVSLRPSSVAGEVLRPGSVRVDRLEPSGLQGVLAVPGPDQAVTLTVARSKDLDTWAVGTDGAAGPGRIYQVTSSTAPTDYAQRGGFQRFRVVAPGMRFGVLSLIHQADFKKSNATSNPIFVQYGAVLQGIPHQLGRRPEFILATAYVGDPPGALVGTDGTMLDRGSIPAQGGTGKTGYVGLGDDADFFWKDRDEADFVTTPPRMFAAYDDISSGGNLVPSQGYLDRISGFTFCIPNGSTAKHVRAQANGRFSEWFRHLEGNPSGLIATIPKGLPYAAPAPANLTWAKWTSEIDSYVAVDYANFGTGDYLVAPTNGRYCEGVPFRPEDCDRLRPTATEFSLFIQLYPTRSVVASDLLANSASTYPEYALNHWGDIGVKIVEQSTRTVSIDIIIG